MIVSEATELPVSSEADCIRLMQIGLDNRAVSATAMNASSSRSHCGLLAPLGLGCLKLSSRLPGPPRGSSCHKACKSSCHPSSIQPHVAGVVYLLVEKAFPDGRVEYGKLALVVSWHKATASGRVPAHTCC